MRIVRLASLVFALVALARPFDATACTPPPEGSAITERAIEDQFLREADVFFRGVIEQVDTTDPVIGDMSDTGFNKPIVTIRHTRTLWGSGAPERLIVPWGYLVACPFPNLREAYWETKERERSVLRPGWGVTVIGRLEDFSDRPDRLFVLIDGEPETSRIVRRFQQLHFGW